MDSLAIRGVTWLQPTQSLRVLQRRAPTNLCAVYTDSSRAVVKDGQYLVRTALLDAVPTQTQLTVPYPTCDTLQSCLHRHHVNIKCPISSKRSMTAIDKHT